MPERKPIVEFHTKYYAKDRDTGSLVGLQTRVIITIQATSTIYNFEQQSQASYFVKSKYGEFKDGNYEVCNQFKKYGMRGYRW